MQRTASVTPYIERKIPYYELLGDEALELIEHNADTVREEIGIEFSDYPDALKLLKNAGADIDGERVRFPRGMCRSIIQASAPSEYTQHARNPARNVIVGGKRTILVPAYGSPFVHDIDKGRRYATLEDFQNFVKLAYMSPVHESRPASLGRYDLRARGRTGQQTPLRYGVQPRQIQRQALHGVGDAP
jgi:trimethylamine--corrinoid protein Co-methyltransferase